MSVIFGETRSFPQDNGPDVDLVVFGDEFYSRRETIDGYTVVYDDNHGQYCYATLQDGQFASSSGIPLVEQPPLGLQLHLEESEQIQRQKFAERYAQLQPDERNPFPGQNL
ncbi:MAG: hypothetical protein QNJ46_20000 [Leptolyngbyaceae cyanobacterium MO_188.B28]|nr:hypothetical protein [Leptolyngbyaceae cyanobacterium MO_188.B28]